MIKISKNSERYLNDKPLVRWVYSSAYQQIFLNTKDTNVFATETAAGFVELGPYPNSILLIYPDLE